MQNIKTKEKKGLITLILIIVVYVLIIVGVIAYIKVGKGGSPNLEVDHEKEIKTNQNLDIGNDIIEEIKEDDLKAAPITVEDELAITPPPTIPNQSYTSKKSDIPQIDSNHIDEAVNEDKTEDIVLERQYPTIADVPAGPRPSELDNLDKDQLTASDILNSEDLIFEVEPSKSTATEISEYISNFFGSIGDFFNNLFNSSDSNEASRKAQQLAEIEADIAIIQPNFTSYTEPNGTTWLDHIDKPNPYTENGFYLYLGLTPTGHVYHRTIIRYVGNDWIDLKTILIQTDLNDKALVIDVSDDLQTKDTPVTHSKSEWVDLAPTQENNELLNSIVHAKNIKVTFMGGLQNKEWHLTDNDIKGLRESMYFYNLLKEREKLLNK